MTSGSAHYSKVNAGPPAADIAPRTTDRQQARRSLGKLAVFGAKAAGIVGAVPLERVGQVGPFLHRRVSVKFKDVAVRVGNVETARDDVVNGAQDLRFSLQIPVEAAEGILPLHRESEVHHPEAAGPRHQRAGP